MTTKALGVVGSGHAGVAVAKELAASGHRVVMLDVGESLDPESVVGMNGLFSAQTMLT